MARFQAFFAAAMISGATLQLGHVPALLALFVSAGIGAAFAESLTLN